MYLLILFLPLIAALAAGFGGRWIGGAGSARLTTTRVGLTFLLSVRAFIEVALGHTSVLVQVATWIPTEGATLSWGFLFDSLTCVRLLVVTSISTLVHLYSTEYRSEDPHLPRFRASLSLFTFFRLRLVTADNFLQRFVGWEGVGLASYLLINFWFGRIQANKAAIKARVRNRIGDIGLSLAIFIILISRSSLDYAVVFSLAPARQGQTISVGLFEIPLLDLVAFLLTIGAVGKSAQIGLHTWLPDAREGPTPVSALLHAATRVTAGVFLLCRTSPILEYAPNISFLLTLLGGRTAFLAATTGLVQNDLKRVIAYSTCSQLGYRVFAAGLSAYSVSRFHLSTHAVFKALLFLGAGSVIHAIADEQDIRKRGGLAKILPFTYTTRRVGSLALRGTPFLAGFYSKDVILEVAYGSFLVEGRFAHTLGTVAAVCTAFYSIRLLALTFFGSKGNEARGSRIVYSHAHEPSFPIAFPLGFLSLRSLIVGYTARDRIIGLGTDFWGSSLFTHPAHTYILEAEWLETSTKRIPLRGAITGARFGFLPYLFIPSRVFSLKTFSFGRLAYTFFNRKWRFDKVYAEQVVAPALRFAYTHAYQNMDRGLLEWIGPQGLASEIYGRSRGFVSRPFDLLSRPLAVLLGGLTVRLGVLGIWPILFPLVDGPCRVVLIISLLLLV
jgi:NADH-ubiquinone oxidoreductase chain 5